MTDDHTDPAMTDSDDGRHTPPPRSGSRDQRREETLRALATGQQAYCAYCGQELPPLPSKGGRPTPYCPADADRYGQWGAKTITCAMLDEHREIWVQVYGPDQPMTHLDVHTLDTRLAGLRDVLDPVRAELDALRTRASQELAEALAARDTAEAERDRATDAERAATAERQRAVTDADRARADAETARGERDAAAATARTAEADRDQALIERDAALQAAEQARAERQHALDQVTAAHERITRLQDELASDRAAALDRLDQLRRTEEQARQTLRSTLTEEHEQRIREQRDQFTQQLRDVQAAADQRVAELTDQLAASTRGYADSLAPLHDELATLRGELAARTTEATEARDRFDTLRDTLARAVAADTEDEPLRDQLRRLLPVEPDGDPAVGP